MFFFGIFGIENKSRTIKEFNSIICVCGRLSHLQLIEAYSYFHFFFIPIFKWNKKYYVEARCCGRLFEVPDDYVDELINSDNIDMTRLREMKTAERVCQNCGRHFDSQYKYCPYCGREVD